MIHSSMSFVRSFFFFLIISFWFWRFVYRLSALLLLLLSSRPRRLIFFSFAKNVFFFCRNYYDTLAQVFGEKGVSAQLPALLKALPQNKRKLLQDVVTGLGKK